MLALSLWACNLQVDAELHRLLTTVCGKPLNICSIWWCYALTLVDGNWNGLWRLMLLYPVSPLLQQALQQLFVSLELPLSLASLCLTTTVSPTTASVLCVCVSVCLSVRVNLTDFFLMMQAIWNRTQSPVFSKLQISRLQVDKICSLPNNLASRKKKNRPGQDG